MHETFPHGTRVLLPPRRDRPVAWIGGAAGVELTWSRRWTERVARVSDVDAPDAIRGDARGHVSWSDRPGSGASGGVEASGTDVTTDPCWPTVAVLATDAPGRWQLADAVAVARRWPLTVIVSVATTLGDGRRRSGPALPGIEEIPWYEFPARLTAWFVDLDAGLPGALGLPPAARREERLVQAAEAAARWRGRRRSHVTVAAADRLGVEGLTDMVSALGHTIADTRVGRPAIDTPSDVVVWEVATIDQPVLAWVRLLTSQEPRRRVVVVEAFPRGDGVLAALRAGAAMVLGRPLGLETLSGALAMGGGEDAGLGASSSQAVASVPHNALGLRDGAR